MYIYKYILENLDSLLTQSLLTESEVSLGLKAHLITYVWWLATSWTHHCESICTAFFSQCAPMKSLVNMTHVYTWRHLSNATIFLKWTFNGGRLYFSVPIILMIIGLRLDYKSLKSDMGASRQQWEHPLR